MPWDSNVHNELKKLSSEGKTQEFKKKFNLIQQQHSTNTVNEYLRKAVVEEGNEYFIKLLIKNGVNVDCPDTQSRTTLSWAISKGYINNSQVLISLGADVNKEDSKGNTPLHIAAGAEGEVNNSSQLIELLCRAGATRNVINKKGATPLHEAAKHSLESIHALINYGDGKNYLNTKDFDGNTPLHYAAESETGYNPTYLLMLKADGTINNNSRETAAQTANNWDPGGKDWKAIINFDPSKNHNHEAFYNNTIKMIGEKFSSEGNSDIIFE